MPSSLDTGQHEPDDDEQTAMGEKKSGEEGNSEKPGLEEELVLAEVETTPPDMIPDLPVADERSFGIDEDVQIGDLVYYGDIRGEPIPWIVIQVIDNTAGTRSVRLISQKIVAYKLFNNRYEKTRWETCSLREWLNHVFLEYLGKETVQPDKLQIYTGLESTQDQIWVLSEKEFKKIPEEVRKQLSGRMDKADQDDYVSELTNSCWLRDSGTTESRAKYVTSNGEILQKEVDQQLGVRPVIVLQIGQ